jgi:electron-transferring-flavoprotein dehydrogenase
MLERESMEFDIVIVGGGPAGLATAIRLMQLNSALNICVLEKASEVGGHSLSGAVLELRALHELIPNWRELDAPIVTQVMQDNFLFLTAKKAIRLPTPRPMKNHGNYIISLGKFCRWLASYAENLGINIFPTFAATQLLENNGQIVGVRTGDKGVDHNGEPLPTFQSGMDLYAKQTVIAEGCRGSLTQQLFKKFNLTDPNHPQSYGLGIKELWEIPKDQHTSGKVVHTIGWPLDNNTYGGSFIYHLDPNLIAIGFVVGLDYQNPYLNPYEELQRFKTHPAIRPLLENGKRIEYGARSLNEGGLQSIPKLTFPGGLIVGCAAGFLNVPKIKGIHTAMKSGMLAAESLVTTLDEKHSPECTNYSKTIRQSWVWKELQRVRNIRPAMNWGLFKGLLYAAFDTYFLQGKAPWTFKQHADHLQLKKAIICTPIIYPKHDNKITFDLTHSLFLTNAIHTENQPCHLKLKDLNTPVALNLKEFAGPEQRYCPAGVYEFIENTMDPTYLRINSANCIHCKACDIKDFTQNIIWTPPEGGSGPQYNQM